MIPWLSGGLAIALAAAVAYGAIERGDRIDAEAEAAIQRGLALVWVQAWSDQARETTTANSWIDEAGKACAAEVKAVMGGREAERKVRDAKPSDAVRVGVDSMCRNRPDRPECAAKAPGGPAQP